MEAAERDACEARAAAATADAELRELIDAFAHRGARAALARCWLAVCGLMMLRRSTRVRAHARVRVYSVSAWLVLVARACV